MGRLSPAVVLAALLLSVLIVAVCSGHDWKKDNAPDWVPTPSTSADPYPVKTGQQPAATPSSSPSRKR